MNTTPFWKRPWVIVVAIVLVIAAFGISTYNGFITRSAAVDTQWAQVETQYQRRIDLIPNLVATTKGIADHETEVFTALADARAHYAGATTPDQKAEAASQTESALARLLAITENYPELRSSESFQTLMTQLEGTENRISVERARYNEAVQVYNVSLQRFPGSMFGKLFGFSTHAFFQAANGAENAPTVSF